MTPVAKPCCGQYHFVTAIDLENDVLYWSPFGDTWGERKIIDGMILSIHDGNEYIQFHLLLGVDDATNGINYRILDRNQQCLFQVDFNPTFSGFVVHRVTSLLDRYRITVNINYQYIRCDHV